MVHLRRWAAPVAHFAAPRLQPGKIVVGQVLLARLALSELKIHLLAEAIEPTHRCSELSCLILIFIFVYVSNDKAGSTIYVDGIAFVFPAKH